MLKRILLGLAIMLTAANLAAGAAYAAICQSSGGARSCGLACQTNSNGSCSCTGECSATERNWVAGSGDKVAMMEEMAAY